MKLPSEARTTLLPEPEVTPPDTAEPVDRRLQASARYEDLLDLMRVLSLIDDLDDVGRDAVRAALRFQWSPRTGPKSSKSAPLTADRRLSILQLAPATGGWQAVLKCRRPDGSSGVVGKPVVCWALVRRDVSEEGEGKSFTTEVVPVIPSMDDHGVTLATECGHFVSISGPGQSPKAFDDHDEQERRGRR